MPQDPRPFDVVDSQFEFLQSGLKPLSLPGSLLGGEYIGRSVPLGEVRTALLRRGTGYGTRDRVVAELVRRARSGEPWGTALAGVLMPGLRSIIGPTARVHPWFTDDLEAECLVGFFEAVAVVQPQREHLAASLLWAARRKADRALARELTAFGEPVPPPRGGLAEPASSERVELGDCADWPLVDDIDTLAARLLSADALLEEARRAGVLSAADVEAIAATRIERVPARDYADAVNGDLGSVRLKRYRAERRLVRWLERR